MLTYATVISASTIAQKSQQSASKGVCSCLLYDRTVFKKRCKNIFGSRSEAKKGVKGEGEGKEKYACWQSLFV